MSRRDGKYEHREGTRGKRYRKDYNDRNDYRGNRVYKTSMTRLKESLLQLGEQSDLYSITSIRKVLDCSNLTADVVIPSVSHRSDNKYSGKNSTDLVQSERKQVLDIMVNIVELLPLKSSLCALLIVVWAFDHCTEWEPVTKDEVTKEEVGSNEVRGREEIETKTKPEDVETKIRESDCGDGFYNVLIQELLNKLTDRLQNNLNQYEPYGFHIEYYEHRASCILRFLTDLTNVNVLDAKSYLMWLSKLTNLGHELLASTSETDDTLTKFEMYTKGASLVSLAMEAMCDLGLPILNTHSEFINELRDQFKAVVDEIGLPRATSMRGRFSLLYSNLEAVKSMSYIQGLLMCVNDTIMATNESFRPLAIYDSPVARDDSRFAEIFKKGAHFRPIVLPPLQLVLQDVKMTIGISSVKTNNVVADKVVFDARMQEIYTPKYYYQVFPSHKLQEYIKNVKPLSQTERFIVMRYTHQILETYSDNANECARALLMIPIVHDSVLLIIVDAVFSEILRVPKSTDNVIFYCRVLYVMHVYQNGVLKTVEHAVHAVMENLYALSPVQQFVLEDFYALWWSYVTENAGDNPITDKEEESILEDLQRVVKNGNYIDIDLWFDVGMCDAATKNEKSEMKVDEEGEDVTSDVDLSLPYRTQSVLVKDFLRRVVQKYATIATLVVAKQRLPYRLHYMLPMSSEGMMEYLDGGDLVVTSHSNVKSEEKNFKCQDSILEFDKLSSLISAMNMKIIKDTEEYDDAVGHVQNVLNTIRTMENAPEVKSDVDTTIVESIPDSTMLEISTFTAALLIKGQASTAHFNRVIEIYGHLLKDILYDDRHLANMKTRLLVEVIRFWQNNPARLYIDIKTLLKNGMISIKSVTEVILTSLSGKTECLFGFLRPTNSRQTQPSTALLQTSKLAPDDTIFPVLLDTIVSLVQEITIQASCEETRARREKIEVDNDVLVQSELHKLHYAKVLAYLFMRGADYCTVYNSNTMHNDTPMSDRELNGLRAIQFAISSLDKKHMGPGQVVNMSLIPKDETDLEIETVSLTIMELVEKFINKEFNKMNIVNGLDHVIATASDIINEIKLS